VEAMACGTPVIGYRKGGLCETLLEGKTGIFFDHPSAEALCQAVQDFERREFDPKICRAHAEQFSLTAFNSRFQQCVQQFCDATRSLRTNKIPWSECKEWLLLQTQQKDS